MKFVGILSRPPITRVSKISSSTTVRTMRYPNSVVVRDRLSGHGTSEWLLFENPIAVVAALRLDEVMAALHTVAAYASRGFYAAGFVSYEASGAMDAASNTHSLEDMPLLWFGIYERREPLHPSYSDLPEYHLGVWRASVSVHQYRKAVAEIKEAIRRGDCYQVNYTFRLRNTFHGDPWGFFLALHQAQQSECSAYLNLGHRHICCASPELFFSLRDGILTCRPMKGTAERGSTPSEDIKMEQWLASSTKDRAENVMVVDMVRNDMARVAEPGTVRVEKLFSIERYPTVLQMTSTVSARVSASIPEIFRAMFPAASISGAPKLRSMQVIKSLESEARGAYTGAIGYIGPDGNSQFNVAIRMAVIDTQTHCAEYGLGSGIVWDSEADAEYGECRTKARILDLPTLSSSVGRPQRSAPAA